MSNPRLPPRKQRGASKTAWFLAAFYILAPGQARAFDTPSLLKECAIAMKMVHGDQLPATSSVEAAHCLGFVEGAATGMKFRHNVFQAAFPTLRESQLSTASPEVTKFVGALLKGGVDICLTNSATIQILTQMLVNFLDKHPENLSLSPFAAANLAWVESYPCKLPP